MIIHLQIGFSQFISFREDLWNFSQSEHIIRPGSHVEYPTGMKNSNFVEDHPRKIPTKFGSNWPSGFGEEAWNLKSFQTTDDRHQVMAKVHLDLWSRWTKNNENASWFIAIKHMLWKYDLKEASWYLDNPVKETIWTAIVTKMVYSHWSGSIIQLLPLYKGLNFLTVENLKTGMIHPLFKINCHSAVDAARLPITLKLLTFYRANGSEYTKTRPIQNVYYVQKRKKT